MGGGGGNQRLYKRSSRTKNGVSNNCVLFRKKKFLPAFAKIYLVSIVPESQIYCLLFVCLRICVVIKC